MFSPLELFSRRYGLGKKLKFYKVKSIFNMRKMIVALDLQKEKWKKIANKIIQYVV